MYATNFEYDGELLSDYGMIICSFDSGSGTGTVSSGTDITFNQAKPSNSDTFGLYSSIYENAYTSTFQIGLLPCGKQQNEMHLTTELVSKLQRWLCRDEYFRFKVIQNGYENIYWNATFSAKQIEIGGQIVGLELTLTADSPYGHTDEENLEYVCQKNSEFFVYNQNDKVGYCYPSLKIEILSDGDFKLTNKTTGDETVVLGCKNGEIITIDGDNQIITSSISTHNIARFFNYNFPRLKNKYEHGMEMNENVLSPSLPCKITITYSPIIRVGL